MDAASVIQLIEIATALFKSVTGNGKLADNAMILEQLAQAVAAGYQAETGKPIDPSKFTFEAPL